MTEETKTPVVKFIMNKSEVGNVHTALKTLVMEKLTAGPIEDVKIMKLMGLLAPIYDGSSYEDTLAVELDPDSAKTCWQALSYVMENALAPESQQTKLISLIQHMGFALEVLAGELEEKPDNVLDMRARGL